MKKIFLIGAGGHCHSCIDVIEQGKIFKIEGIFDVNENVGKKIFDYDIIGTDDEIIKYIKSDNYFLITVGQIKNIEPRIRIYKLLKSLNAQIATVVSPRAHVSLRAKIGEGTIVLHDALVNAGATVGVNCIINTKSLIEHDAIIEDHCHISTATIINGNCIVETQSFVGSNAVLKEGVIVKKGTLIPAGDFYRGK